MKKIKYVLFVLFMIPCIFLFSACGAKTVVGIKKTDTIGNSDVYTITYSDGSTDAFTVKNGEDGKDLTIEEIYNAAVVGGYDGDLLDFIKDYLELDIDMSDDNSVSTSILSSVAIYSEFPTTSRNYATGGTINNISLGAGSGVIYKLDKSSGDAYLITNYHVVYNADCSTSNKISNKISCFLYGSHISVGYKTSNGVKLYDSNNYPIIEYSDSAIFCEYVGGSMNYDIAVLKISGSDILKNSDARAVEIENSDAVTAGSTAIAIGNPSGEGISVSQGVVSVDSEYIEMTGADEITEVQFRVMRIDTAINSGNSGGGLFNDAGELIGIVNAKIIDSSIENIAYAIPSNIATRVADNILTYAESHNEKAYKATLGVTVEAKNSRAKYDAETLTTKIVEDVYVYEVTAGGAVDGKLQLGDKILSIKVKDKLVELDRMYQVVDSTWLMKVGDVVEFVILRNGKKVTETLIMQETHFSEIG